MLGRFSLGLVSTLALVNAAEAADVYAREEQSFKETSIDASNTWTGFYAGVHLGAAVGDERVADPYGPSIYGDSILTPGALAGGQMGYNFQFGRLVTGVEADASWTNLDGTNTCLAYSAFYLSSNCRVHADVLGSFSGRIGTVFGDNDTTLLYVKGGAAWEDVSVNAKVNGGNANATSSDATLWGWTVGAGVEHALTPGWSVKVEYDYVDFGDNGMSTPASVLEERGGGHGFGRGGGMFYRPVTIPGTNTSLSQDLHELKVGLNYRFDADNVRWTDDALSLKDIPAAFRPATEIEFGTRYAWSWSRFQKNWGFQGLNTSNLNSRLTYDNMTANGGEIFARLDMPQNVMIKGFAGLGSGDSGHMHDEDWISHPVISYSNTVSNTSEDIKYGTVDAGYDIFRGSDYKVAPFVGYSYLGQNMKALGCKQLADPDQSCTTPIPVSTLAITERDAWQALRVGAAVEAALLPRLQLSLDAAYLPYAWFSGSDYHLLRTPPFVSPESGHGTGAQVEASLSYAVTNSWRVGAGGRFLTEWTTHADLNFAGDGRHLPQRMSVEQVTGFAQLSYKFGLFDQSLDATPVGEQSVKDGPLPPAAAWNGLYVGVNGGGALGQDPGSATIETIHGSANIPGPQPSGAFGGGQIGYNWQSIPSLGLGSRLVVGLEADIEGSSLNDGIWFLPSPLAVSAARSSKANVDYFGTVRGRFGYAMDGALIYATGGFAYGGLDYKIRNGSGRVIYTSDDNIETGYAIGGGLEYKINPSWSIKAEYQYISLGDFDLRDPVNTAAHARDAEADFHSVRLGLNYRLDGALPSLN